MDVILLFIRLTLFAVFALAAIGKFLDLKGAEKAVKDFGTPDELAKPMAIALPIAEIIFAFCFLSTSMSWLGAIGGLILLLTFTGGMIAQMAQGRAPDCHCFGQIHSEPVSPKTLVRNIIFSILSLFLVAQGRDNQGLSLADGNANTMQLLLLFIAVALLAAALFYLKKVLDNQTQILRRLDVMDVIARDGASIERADAGHPQDGLPIGSPFPDFELPDTSGRTVTLESMVANGRPTLLFFVSPKCDPCRAMLPAIEEWEAELGSRMNFVMLSEGTADANREKFAGTFENDVIMQKGREIADATRARWTPTAVFIRTDGTIGSHLAAGDVAIRELIEKARTEDLDTAGIFFSGSTVNGDRKPKIGEPLPDFSLTDSKGNPFTADSVRGKKTLAVFWSLTCPHCTAMMNDLKSWNEQRRDDDPQLVVFSDGSAEEHERIDLDAPILLDKGYVTAGKLGMFGTPSAVVLDEDGRIATETGVGAANIWALIGKRK